eukprot:TRINITY_DN3410_c0_g1_i1.p1 TRINITY_DN3410_c0_g1~~TRINITY_DN3410_c0_g1_i1.p1  ORF type:complete len:646 (-),score=175.55 TRINITY_DN3410_c0_g1_i1:103-1950(-)
MKKVLEAGPWSLFENDDGTKMWFNASSEEIREYGDDIPEEVVEYLESQKENNAANNAPLETTAKLAPTGDAGLAGGEATAQKVPFKRERGLAAQAAQGGAAGGGGYGALGSTSGTGRIGAAAPLQPYGGGGGGAAMMRNRAAEPPATQGLHLQPGESPWEDEKPGYWAAGGSGMHLQPGESPWEDEKPGYWANDSGGGGGFPQERPPTPPEPPADLQLWPQKEVTTEVLLKGTNQRPNKGETNEHLLSRITHLHLESKGLNVLGEALSSACKSLRVLYASENKIHTMAPLRDSTENAYLGANRLWEMGSWSRKLPKLRLLDLGENALSLVDGLDRSSQLRELVLRAQKPTPSSPSSAGKTKQRAPQPQPLRFAPRTLLAIAPGLQVLDVSQNSLVDLSPLACLRRLQRLDAASNLLPTMAAVAAALRGMQDLRWLRLEDNPLCYNTAKYRDQIVLLAARIEELDGKTIGAAEHAFLGELDRRRARQRSRRRAPSLPAGAGHGHSGDAFEEAAHSGRRGREDIPHTGSAPAAAARSGGAAARSASEGPRRPSSGGRRSGGQRSAPRSGGSAGSAASSAAATHLPPLMPPSVTKGGGGSTAALHGLPPRAKGADSFA